jgi:two-component sensor histidine kinase
VGAALDISAHKAAEEGLSLLVAELQHRTRNLIAVVSALADKTVRESQSLEDFRERFGDRLAAVSRVQSLLSRLTEGERVSFDSLIRTELDAHAASPGQVTLEGPAGVRLRSGSVQTFALALHELATNAVKYGALSQPFGRLSVVWSVEQEAQPMLHVDWRETGVALNDEAGISLSGYGRELIERALPYQMKARTSYAFGPDGVHCTIAAPISGEG